MYALIPTNGRRSFGGKAVVLEDGDTLTLVSYATEVAKVNTVAREYTLNGYYSQTTGAHIRDFLRHCGVKDWKLSKREIESRVGKTVAY